MEEKRLAIIGIFVSDLSRSETVNALLHEYGAHIAGRALPRARGVGDLGDRRRAGDGHQRAERQARPDPGRAGKGNVHKIIGKPAKAPLEPIPK